MIIAWKKHVKELTAKFNPAIARIIIQWEINTEVVCLFYISVSDINIRSGGERWVHTGSVWDYSKPFPPPLAPPRTPSWPISWAGGQLPPRSESVHVRGSAHQRLASANHVVGSSSRFIWHQGERPEGSIILTPRAVQPVGGRREDGSGMGRSFWQWMCTRFYVMSLRCPSTWLFPCFI